MLDNENEFKKHHVLRHYLNTLESELRRHELWHSDRPSDAALSSNAPFAIDSLTFVQWLQFIFIDKMTLLLQSALPLPRAMSVLPMAQEYFKNQAIDSAQIEAIIGHIDLLINENGDS